MGQSSRLRTLQYVPYLESQGIHVKVAPLFQDSYVRDLQAGRRDPAYILKAYLKRINLLGRMKGFDILWLEKEMLPWIPFSFEGLLLRKAKPMVLDIDDADFHHYDLAGNPITRFVLGSKIGRLMSRSAMVIAGNDYLAEYARSWGAPAVEKLPTVVDLERYPLKERPLKEGKPVTIGWIGSPTTAPYIKIIAPVLRELSSKYQIRLVLVGSGSVSMEGLNPEIHAWTEEREAEMVSGFDIGIMPLAATPWERGKCGYKLIQYMACAKPVVASAFGANLSIVTHGKEGFLAEDAEEWKSSLELLIRNRRLREQMGREGRLLVEKKYSTAVTAPRILHLLRKVYEKAG
jgi:glycosyltransferase involved in cell wall biosynthesis